MPESLALVIVVLAAVFLIGLAALSFLMPSYAVRFLGGFAGSARAHFLEMAVRLITGAAFVVYAPNMLYSSLFWLFSWALVVSTVVLVLLPWRWHHRFGQQFVRPIIRHVWLFGVVSLTLGSVILFAVVYGEFA